MSRVRLRPTVAADFLALQGAPPTYRCRCLTAVLGDRILGIGGLVYRDGAVWASVLMSDEARRFPAAIHRAGLAAIAEFKRLGLKRVLATAQPGNPAAEAWLRRLGFAPAEIAGARAFIWTDD